MFYVNVKITRAQQSCPVASGGPVYITSQHLYDQFKTKAF